jgi:teichuronic acid biosynthesis glycosyltransferase TuaG
MSEDLVSIVMPAYNAEPFLERSVASVLAQTFADWELLIVDDRSTDATWRMAQGFAAADARVRPLQQAQNGGVAAARNAGIEAARGSHIAFLDSDDWWHPRKLELQVGAMRQSGARVSYAAYQRVSESGKILSKVSPPPRIAYRDMLKSNHIGNLTGMYRRSLGDVRFQRIGHEDYVFWLQLMRLADNAIRVDHDEPLAYYLVRDGSVSANKWRAAGWQWRIYREVLGLGAPAAAWYMGFYLWHAVGKRITG